MQGPCHLGLRVVQVDLNHLAGGRNTVVAQRHREPQRAVRRPLPARRKHRVRPHRRVVGQPVAEGVERRRVHRAHVAAHRQGGREVCRGLVRALRREAHRQPPGRIHPPGQHVRQRVRALLARQEAADHSREPVDVAGELVGAAHHRWFRPQAGWDAERVTDRADEPSRSTSDLQRPFRVESRGAAARISALAVIGGPWRMSRPTKSAGSVAGRTTAKTTPMRGMVNTRGSVGSRFSRRVVLAAGLWRTDTLAV
jgi:hypothetical protein